MYIFQIADVHDIIWDIFETEQVTNFFSIATSDCLKDLLELSWNFRINFADHLVALNWKEINKASLVFVTLQTAVNKSGSGAS